MRQQQSNEMAASMQPVIVNGSDEMRAILGQLLNLAMRLEREQFLARLPACAAYEEAVKRAADAMVNVEAALVALKEAIRDMHR